VEKVVLVEAAVDVVLERIVEVEELLLVEAVLEVDVLVE